MIRCSGKDKFVSENAVTFNKVGIDIPYDIIRKIIEFLENRELFNFALCSNKIWEKKDLQIRARLIKDVLGLESLEEAKNFLFDPYIAVLKSRWQPNKLKNFFSRPFTKTNYFEYCKSKFEIYGDRNVKNIAFYDHNNSEESDEGFNRKTNIEKEAVRIFSVYFEQLNFSVLQNYKNLKVFICNKFFFKILFEDDLSAEVLKDTNRKLRTIYVYEHKFKGRGMDLDLEEGKKRVCKEFAKYPMDYKLLFKCAKIFENLKTLYCEWALERGDDLEEILNTCVKTEEVDKLKKNLNRDFKIVNIFIPFNEKDENTFFLNKLEMLKRNFEIPPFIKSHLEFRLKKFDLSNEKLFSNKIKNIFFKISDNSEYFRIYADICKNNSEV